MSAHRDIRGVITGGLLAGALLLTTAAPTLGQNQDYDARWLPWLGCWEPVTGPADSDAPMLCLRPLAEGEGVEMLTVVDGEIASQETIRADGMNRQTSREGCDGWERTSFSDDGRRIYLRADFVCEGGVERRSTGLMAMVSPYEWLDVRTVDVAGESVPWVLRYQLATLEAVEAVGLEGIAANRAMAQQTARIAASSALTMEAVMDVSSHMDAKAVEAWIVESGDQFALDAGRLVAMADADVPESVIDIVVAVSYPEQFVVDRNLEGGADVAESEYTRTGRYGRSGRVSYGCGRYYDPLYYDPFFLSPFYSPYAGCSYYSPYRYGFGYNLGYGGFGFGYGTYGTYRPTIVVVGRRQQESQGRPRAVRGRGYTRGLGSGSSSAGPGQRLLERGGCSPEGQRRGQRDGGAVTLRLLVVGVIHRPECEAQGRSDSLTVPRGSHALPLVPASTPEGRQGLPAFFLSRLGLTRYIVKCIVPPRNDISLRYTSSTGGSGICSVQRITVSTSTPSSSGRGGGGGGAADT